MENTEQGGKNVLLKIGNGLEGNAATFTASSDLVTITAHGLSEGDLVSFSVVNTTTTVVIDTDYYVVAPVLANTFKISATAGGTAINIDADGTGTSQETFQNIGAIRSKTFSAQAEEIDITNQDSGEWKSTLDQAGIRSVTLSGDGVFKDDSTFAKVRQYFLAQSIKNWRLVVSSAGSYWQGAFKITSLEQAGDYNAEQTYSVSLGSSGAVSYTDL